MEGKQLVVVYELRPVEAALSLSLSPHLLSFPPSPAFLSPPSFNGGTSFREKLKSTMLDLGIGTTRRTIRVTASILT